MWQIFIGSFILSVLHVSIPNHWIPIITIGKAEKWTKAEISMATLITGFAHTLSTVIIGIIVGYIGVKLSEYYSSISGIVAPGVLILLGIVYIITDLSKMNKPHEHFHESGSTNKKSFFAVLFSLSLAMFLTPCAELEAYYFKASTIGWSGVFIVSIVYTITTVTLMILYVNLGNKVIAKINSHFLEHHEKGITGILLVILGCIAYFLN